MKFLILLFTLFSLMSFNIMAEGESATDSDASDCDGGRDAIELAAPETPGDQEQPTGGAVAEPSADQPAEE